MGKDGKLIVESAKSSKVGFDRKNLTSVKVGLVS